MLHDQDTKVLLLDDIDNKKVFYMDLEKGKVVSEYVKKNLFDLINSSLSKQSNLYSSKTS